jgi:transcriptional regulator
MFFNFNPTFLISNFKQNTKRKSILDNKRNDVLPLLNSGHTVAEIVRRVKVSKATVCSIKKIACPDRKKAKGDRP